MAEHDDREEDHEKCKYVDIGILGIRSMQRRSSPYHAYKNYKKPVFSQFPEAAQEIIN